MTETEMLRLANEGHLKLIAALAAERDNLVWQRDQLKEINDRMAEDRIRLIDERDAAIAERNELRDELIRNTPEETGAEW